MNIDVKAPGAGGARIEKPANRLMMEGRMSRKDLLMIKRHRWLELSSALILGVFFTIHSPKFAAAAEISLNRPRHIVFLIHGLAADKTVFGAMEPALKKGLPALNPRFDYDVVNFEYDTGNDHKDTYQFARQFAQFLEQTFASRPLRPQDRISLVAHSQGGVVAMIWLARSAAGDPEYSPRFSKYLESFVTLATPYWGAKVALFASTVKNVTDFYHVPFPFKMGKQELRDLSLGSVATLKFRRKTLAPDFQDVLRDLRGRIRPLQITGLVSSLESLHPFVTGEDEFEDDTAVPVPSGRFDYLYSATSERSGAPISYDSFRQTGTAHLMVVDSMHLTPITDHRDFPGIAQVWKSCIDDPDCEHPAYRHVLRHVAGQAVTEVGALERMTSFLIDLAIRVNGKDQLKPRDVSIQVLPSGDPLSEGVTVIKPFELYAKGIRLNELPGEQVFRAWMTGAASGGTVDRDRKVVLEVSAPGYLPRRVEAKVRPTFTTFVEFPLIPAVRAGGSLPEAAYRKSSGG